MKQMRASHRDTEIGVAWWEAHICFISVPCLFHACFTLIVFCLSLLTPAVSLLVTQLLCATFLSLFQLLSPCRYSNNTSCHVNNTSCHHVSGLASLTSCALITCTHHTNKTRALIGTFHFSLLEGQTQAREFKRKFTDL